MICPECHGTGETIYYVETDRDENTVTVEQRKGICRTCNGSGAKPFTNADRIRAMSDEQLVDFMNNFNICDTRSNEECKFTFFADCRDCVLEWLQQEAE